MRVWNPTPDPDDPRPAPQGAVGPTGAETLGDWVDFLLCDRHLPLAPETVVIAARPDPDTYGGGCAACATGPH